jgi:hypothetical protein
VWGGTVDAIEDRAAVRARFSHLWPKHEVVQQQCVLVLGEQFRQLHRTGRGVKEVVLADCAAERQLPAFGCDLFDLPPQLHLNE